MMDPTATNDFMAFFAPPEQYPGLPSRLPSTFKFPQTHGYPSLVHDTTIPSRPFGFYTPSMHTSGSNVSSAGIPSMPVAFDSARPTMVKQNSNIGKLSDGRQVNMPLNAQWHWAPSASMPQRSNWPDCAPQQYPPLYQPSVNRNERPAAVAASQSDMTDLQSPFYPISTFTAGLSNSSMDPLEPSPLHSQPQSRRPSVISLSSLQLDSPDDSSEERGSPRSSKSTTPDRDSIPQSSKSLPSSSSDQPKKKSPKMHTCHICQRSFPRPSGLQVHLNSHNGLKPFTCEFPSCDRKFTVRSNARRHLRTHGVTSASLESSKKEGHHPITVAHETTSAPPSAISDSNNSPKILRWIPHSLSGNAATGGEADGHGKPFNVDLSSADASHYTTYHEVTGYWPS